MADIRKVQLTGSSTYTVSLPKQWANKNNVKSGTKLYIFEVKDGSLTIKLDGKYNGDKEETTINTVNLGDPEEIQRMILAKYIQGYRIIKIISKNRFTPEIRKKAVSEIDRLVGLEIVEEKNNELLVQDFFSREGFSIDKTLKRAHIITSRMHEDLIDGIKNKDKELLKSIDDRDDEVDRLRFLITRQLNLAINNSSYLADLGLNSSDCLNYGAVITAIEETADHIQRIAQYELMQELKKLDKNTINQILMHS